MKYHNKIMISLVATILILAFAGCSKAKNDHLKEIPICDNIKAEQPKIIYTKSQGYCLMLKK